MGHPLTVYGKGGQTRGFINIADTARCIEITNLHPADRGERRVFNQFTEEFSVLDLAQMVQRVATMESLTTEVVQILNPRFRDRTFLDNIMPTVKWN